MAKRKEPSERTRLEQETGRRYVERNRRKEYVYNLPATKVDYPGGGMVRVNVLVGSYTHTFIEPVAEFPSDDAYSKILLLVG